MTTYALERADPALRKMVKEAKAGETVVLTENGKPVAEVKSTHVSDIRSARGISSAEIDEIAKIRNKFPRLPETGAETLRKIRDEGS